MEKPVSLLPDQVYDDGAILLSLGITAVTLANARRERKLRYTRKGRRTFYLGKWILEWLEREQEDELQSCRGGGR